jgi:hypothetical protein
MRCFYHQDKEAVGTCRSCGKGVCIECAVDLGKGLACRSRCEETARAVIALIDRNIQLSVAAPTAQVVAPSQPARGPSQAPDYVATQLSSHIRSTRQFRWLSGTLYLIIAVTLLAAGLTQQIVLLDVLGAVLLVFGVITLFQAQRSSRQPQLPETVTR